MMITARSPRICKSTLTHHKHAECRQPLIMAPDIREESERARETTAERAKVAATDWGGAVALISHARCVPIAVSGSTAPLILHGPDT